MCNYFHFLSNDVFNNIQLDKLYIISILTLNNMSNDINSKYTYPVMEFLSLTSYPFQEGYYIPGLIENRNEALTIGLLSQIQEATEQKYLATALGISRSGVTVLITDMINKNLLEQEPNPDDRRGYLLKLTDLGRKIAAWMIYRKQVFNDIQLKGFTSEEIATFNNLATRMAENVLDSSERELKRIPTFNEADWVVDQKKLTLISDENRELFHNMSKRVQKIIKVPKKS